MVRGLFLCPGGSIGEPAANGTDKSVPYGWCDVKTERINPFPTDGVMVSGTDKSVPYGERICCEAAITKPLRALGSQRLLL